MSSEDKTIALPAEDTFVLPPENTKEDTKEERNPEQTVQLPNVKELDVIASKYRLEKLIGQGGMGKIYLATQLGLNRSVAIKLMLAPEDDTATQRFEDEASITGNLRHPNTIRIIDFGLTDNGILYLVMEHLNGINISQYLKRHGAFEPMVAAKIIYQLCGSLSEAHSQDLIHRDIKPGNIMLVESAEEGEGLYSKLLDFGLVKNLETDLSRTQTGMILGSPMYMSPEQIEGEDIDGRSDLYSLGLTLYMMLANRRPFKEGNMSSLLAAQLFKEPTPLTDINISLVDYPALLWIVSTAIQKKKEKRFSSARQMKKALEIAMHNPQAELSLINGQLYSGDMLITEKTGILEPQVAPINQPERSLPLQNTDQFNLSGASQTLHQASSPTEDSPAPTKNNNWIFAIIALLGIGAITFFVTPPKQNTVQPNTTQIIETKPATKTLVTLESTPTNANVILLDGNEEVFLGNTPFSIRLKEEDRKNVELRFDGYEPQKLTLIAASPNPKITLKEKQTAATITAPTERTAPQPIVPRQPPPKVKPKKSDDIKTVVNPFLKNKR